MILIKSANGETEILSIPEVIKAYFGQDQPRLLENSAVLFSRSNKYCFFRNSITKVTNVLLFVLPWRKVKYTSKC